MRETLIPGDRILVDCWHYRHTPPTRGDLVVFKSDALLLVKRVIATGGDTIESRNGVIVVNGMRIDEPYVRHTGNPTREMQTFGPRKVAPNKVFVMGDNRDESFDSRLTVAYDVSAVVAKPLYIYGFDRARRGKVLQ